MKVPSLQEKPMSGIKALVGKRISKKVKIMDAQIDIYKLTVGEIEDIQHAAKEIEAISKRIEAGENVDGSSGLEVLKKVIALGAEGGNELTDDDFSQLPLEELSKLSEAILEYNGMKGK